jgi:hypothetical protein
MIVPSYNQHVTDLPKKEKQSEKSWKERQREGRLKRQRSQEAYQAQREIETRKKPRKYPKGKIIFGICLIGLIFTAYAVWQYSNQPPRSTGGTTSNPPPTGSAPNFQFTDVNGTQFTLNQSRGKVIVIHFMFPGCGGALYLINENRLKILKSVCSTFCGKQPVTIVSVAATTCANSVETIRADYGVTWTLGNDYADGKADVINAYSPYSIEDGTIVIIDKAFNVANVYTEETTFETLASRISQLL